MDRQVKEMTVSELIEALQQYPQDADVVCESREFRGELDSEGIPVEHEFYRHRQEELHGRTRRVNVILF